MLVIKNDVRIKEIERDDDDNNKIEIMITC